MATLLRGMLLVAALLVPAGFAGTGAADPHPPALAWYCPAPPAVC